MSQVTDCCATDPSNVDGTENQCLACGAKDVEIVSHINQIKTDASLNEATKLVKITEKVKQIEIQAITKAMNYLTANGFKRAALELASDLGQVLKTEI